MQANYGYDSHNLQSPPPVPQRQIMILIVKFTTEAGTTNSDSCSFLWWTVVLLILASLFVSCKKDLGNCWTSTLLKMYL